MEYIIITLAFVFSAFVYMKIAVKFNILDKPNHRSSHTKPTIRGGGVLFYLAVLLFFIKSDFNFPYFFIGLSLIAIISFVDDLVSLSSKLRLIFQLIAVVFICIQLSVFSSYGWLVALPVILMGIAFMNIYNFMDGINGITGLYSISYLIGIYLINYNEKIIENSLLFYLFISIVIFGYYNFRKKARFFAGDIGSISIATTFFFIGLMFFLKLNSPLVLLLFAVYGVDSLVTMVYRKIVLKENIMEAHRHHIYQKLTDKFKLSHMTISSIYALIQLFINLLVYFFYKNSYTQQWGVFFAVIISMLLLYFCVFIRHKNYK